MIYKVIYPNGRREWFINGKHIVFNLKNYIDAIEEDPSFVENEQFIDFIKQQENIPVKYQERMLKVDPRLAQYIPNLDPKFEQTRQAVGFGMFS